MDTFTTYGGPANLLEAANTMGLPLYARQHLDEKGRWIDLMAQHSDAVLVTILTMALRLSDQQHRCAGCPDRLLVLQNLGQKINLSEDS
jgi:hypothetical protein